MNEPLSHTGAFELLPWLVNGSLAAPERDAVELHVRDCLLCRRELKDQQRLRAALRAQPAVHISAQAGLDQLNRRLNDDIARVAARPARGVPTWLRFATVGAAGVVLLAALFWIVPRNDDAAGNYATLATDPHRDAQIDLIFAQATSAADIHALLDEIGGKITAGPSSVGRYAIRLENRQRSDAETAALVERLAQDPRVRFAGRALAAEPQ